MKRYPSRSTQTLFYGLSGAAGLFTALFVLIDVIAVNSVTDSFNYMFFTGVAGLITGIAILMILNYWTVERFGQKVPLGLVVDPAFRKKLFLPRTAMQYIAIASIFNVISATIYFWAAASFDPTIILPLMQFVVIYLVLIEFFIDRDIPSLIEIQCLFSIALGAFLATIKPGEIDLILVALVLIPLNLGSTLSTYYQKKAKSFVSPSGEKVDAIRLRFWMVIGVTVGLSIISFPFLNLGTISEEILLGFFMAGISMFLAFVAHVCYLRALGMGKMYVVEAVSSSKVIFATILTIVVAFLFPDLLPLESLDAIFWFIKVIGVILVSLGVIVLALAEIRQYLLIIVESGKSKEVMEALFAIKGVTSVAVVAGNLDIIAKVRVRTIGKTLGNIITRVEKIPGVRSLQTALILAEKERFGRSGAYR